MILAPTQETRHVLMDVGRGAAILGILWLNIFIFALPFEAMVIPGIWGDANTLNLATWNFVSIGIAGVMRGMISMLFGAAALMMLWNAEKAAQPLHALDRFFRRLLWLIFFGAIHAYLLLWPHDILFVYGVLGLLIFPFRNMPVNKMLILAGVMLVGSIIFTAQNSNEIQEAQTTVDETLSDEQLRDLRQQEPLIENYDDSSLQSPAFPDFGSLVLLASDTSQQAETTDPETDALDREFNDLIERISAEVEKRQEGYISNVISMASESFEEQTSEMLSNHLLDVATFFLFGMAMLKSGFFTSAWSTSRYVLFMVAGHVIGLSLGSITSLTYADGSTLASISALVSDYTYDLRRLSLAVANFALIAVLLRLQVLNFLTNTLAACGRMAFSLYISQTIICNLLFLGFGLGLYGQLEHYQIAIIAIFITLLQMIVAPIYLRYFKQGPLEWLLRWLVDFRLVKPMSTA